MSPLTELFQDSMGCLKGDELSAPGGDQVGTVTPWRDIVQALGIG